MKILKKISFILLALLALCMVCIILFNLITAIKRSATGDRCPTVLGFATAVVASGSMEPSIMINDLVIIHAKDEYAVGDVVTYRTEGTPVTHRVVDKYTEGGVLYYTTHGDFNADDKTEKVPATAVVGKVVAVIPYFGLLHGFLQKPMGIAILTLVLAAYILLPDLLRARKERKRTHLEEADVPNKEANTDKNALQQQIAALENTLKERRERAAQKRKFWGLALLAYLIVIAIILVFSYTQGR